MRYWPAASVLVAALVVAPTGPAIAAPTTAVEELSVISLEPAYVCWESIPPLAENRRTAAEPQDCQLRVVLSKPPQRDVLVLYRTLPGSATPQLDYVEVREGVTKIAPGATAGFVTVRVLPDKLREPDETFAVQLVKAEGAVIGRPLGVVTIREVTVPPGG